MASTKDRLDRSLVSRAAVASFGAAIASVVRVQSTAIGTARSTDSHAVAASAAGLSGAHDPILDIVGGNTAAAARTHESWRLWWAESKVEETSKHKDAENWHGQQWVDKDKSKDGRKSSKLDHLGAKETAVRELVSTHLSKDVRRKRWDGTNALADRILDLGLDRRVGVDSLENEFLEVHLILQSAMHLPEVLAKDREGDKGQEAVENGKA